MEKEQKGRWTKESAIECLRRNGFKVGEPTAIHTAPGIKIWGAIDFLSHHCKMEFVRQYDQGRREAERVRYWLNKQIQAIKRRGIFNIESL